MKITVIGGGGVRSLFLAKSLAQNAQRLGISQVVFMDNDEEKLNIYGKMAAQAAGRLCREIDFSLTADPVKAVEGADYIITTIRSGGDEMRVLDEGAALGLGVLGQETTGAAGFSFAMRSVPALVEYCELARKWAAPDVKIFNFTNPAGVVSQTLRDMGYDFTFGICDAPSSMLSAFARLYGVSPDDMGGECYGLNHLSFFSHIRLKGRDIMTNIIDNSLAYKNTELRFFDKALVKHLGCIPNEYLYYFFYREQAAAHILEAGKTRGEAIRDINLKMTKELSHMDIEGDFENCLKVFEKWYGQRENEYMSKETGGRVNKPPYRFDLYDADAGGYAGVALKYIALALDDKEGEMILCVPNEGAIPGLCDTDVVEITCTVGKGKCIPHRILHPGDIQMEYIRRVKLYERLASLAIREKSIKAAVDCLMVHPLVNSYSLAVKLVSGYLELNKEYTKGWS